jgi:tetratricopeptide (TPR) repeat protein
MQVKMKKPIGIIAGLFLAFQVQAQSLEEGIKMVGYERYEKARQELAPLAAGNARANYYLGLAELGLEHTDAAAAIFSKFPDDPANMAGSARVAFIRKNPAEGMRLAQAVVAKAKKKDWEHFRFAADAITYTEGGDIQQAISWYKTALQRNDNWEVRIGLGDAYRKTSGGGGEAMNNYEYVTGKYPNNSLAHSRVGSLWYGARKYDLALEAWQKAKNADPANPLPYRDLANAYFYSGKYDLARQNVEQYLELSDKSCDDRIQHANLLYLTKEYDAAIGKMQEIISTCGEKPYMYRVIGYSQYESKNYDEALQAMRTFFVKQDPAKVLPSDYLYYGRIMMQTGNPDSADVYLARAVAADTARDKSETYRQIAEGFKDMKTDTGYAIAGSWYARLVAENPDAAPLDYYYWGFWNYYGRKYEEAAKAFEAMEAKYPDQPSATYWRGRAAAAMDPEAKEGIAVPHYTKWLDIPNSDGYSKKNADLMQAYQYLALYHYNKSEKAETQKYLDLITAIEPDNKFVKQVKEAMNAPKKK